MRDRDVRTAMQTALMATSAFDGVYLWGLPEAYGTGSSTLRMATIDPSSSTQTDVWDSQTDGGLLVNSRVMITLLFRHDDPQLRDEGAERLFDVAADALNGQVLAGITVPAHTRFLSWTWVAATPPERRITATFSYEYIVEGWNSYDTTE